MNLYDMNIAEYMPSAVKFDVILAAIDRELEFNGAGEFLAEVLGCQCDSNGKFWDDQTEMFLSRWQKLAQEGPRNDGFVQNFTPERVVFYREKRADLMQSFLAARAEDYADETDNDLFYYAISSIAFEAGYIDFDALSYANKEKYDEAKKKHDYLAQFEQYKRLMSLEEKISALLPELKSALEEYSDTFSSIENFDGDLDAIKSMVSHWANEFYYMARDAESLKDSVAEIAPKD